MSSVAGDSSFDSVSSEGVLSAVFSCSATVSLSASSTIESMSALSVTSVATSEISLSFALSAFS